jgi:hypothetical protein
MGIHQAAASGIDEEGTPPHQAESLSVHQMTCRGAVRQVQTDDIGSSQEFGQRDIPEIQDLT